MPHKEMLCMSATIVRALLVLKTGGRVLHGSSSLPSTVCSLTWQSLAIRSDNAREMFMHNIETMVTSTHRARTACVLVSCTKAWS